MAIAILLPETRLTEWAGRDRELTASERYGMAKLTLKRALDRFRILARWSPRSSGSSRGRCIADVSICNRKHPEWIKMG